MKFVPNVVDILEHSDIVRLLLLILSTSLFLGERKVCNVPWQNHNKAHSQEVKGAGTSEGETAAGHFQEKTPGIES